MVTAPNFSLTGISTIAALNSPIRPGASDWQRGQALHLSAHRSPEAPSARGCRSQVRLTSILAQRAWARERLGPCEEQSPRAVVGGTGQKVLRPLGALTSPAGTLLPRAAPDGFPAHRRTCPCWPPLPLIWTQLSSWSLGQGTFGNADASGGHSSSRPQRPLPLSLENRPKPQRSPLKATAGRMGPSGTSPLLCSPGWRSCQSDARQTPKDVEGYCISWQVHSPSSSCHSLFLLRAARCILKMFHPGCNVNNAEGRSSCWGKAGMCWGRSCLIPLWQ